MKMLCLITIATFLLISCNGLLKQDEVKRFIPGTYISNWKTEFNQSVDTMTIEPLVQNGSEGYLIIRRTNVSYFNTQRKRNPEYKIVKWTGSYNLENKTVFINNNARQLSFDPVNKEMKMGTITYRKL